MDLSDVKQLQEYTERSLRTVSRCLGHALETMEDDVQPVEPLLVAHCARHAQAWALGNSLLKISTSVQTRPMAESDPLFPEVTAALSHCPFSRQFLPERVCQVVVSASGVLSRNLEMGYSDSVDLVKGTPTLGPYLSRVSILLEVVSSSRGSSPTLLLHWAKTSEKDGGPIASEKVVSWNSNGSGDDPNEISLTLFVVPQAQAQAQAHAQASPTSYAFVVCLLDCPESPWSVHSIKVPGGGEPGDEKALRLPLQLKLDMEYQPQRYQLSATLHSLLRAPGPGLEEQRHCPVCGYWTSAQVLAQLVALLQQRQQSHSFLPAHTEEPEAEEEAEEEPSLKHLLSLQSFSQLTERIVSHLSEPPSVCVSLDMPQMYGKGSTTSVVVAVDQPSRLQRACHYFRTKFQGHRL